MNNQQNVQAVLPAGSKRETGREAQINNMRMARLLGDVIRTTLGPKGMDKLLVDQLGDVTVTNDGVTILRELQAEHPAAKMIVEIARTQEMEVGDGTTSTVVIAGELLKRAELLIEDGIHPSIISSGYELAGKKALEYLDEIGISLDNNSLLGICKKSAITAMTGKGSEAYRTDLAEIIVNALDLVRPEDENDFLDITNVTVRAITGEDIGSSKLVKGMIMDKIKIHPNMPDIVKDAKIAVLDIPLESKQLNSEVNVNVSSPTQMNEYIENESKQIKNMVDIIVKSGANVVINSRSIDDIASHFLAKSGILCIHRVARGDINSIAKSTNANIITNLSNIDKTSLGNANIVKKTKIGHSKVTVIEGCSSAKSVTILVRGATDHIVDEVKRAVEDAIGVVSTIMVDNVVVAGAGSSEIYLSMKIKDYAETLSGKEQIVLESYAKALEIIPKSLAENSGLDPIDIVANLKSEHKKLNTSSGINVYTGKVMDAWKEGIIEPLKVKKQAISSATSVSMMLLRIDDNLAVNKNPNDPRQSQEQQ